MSGSHLPPQLEEKNPAGFRLTLRGPHALLQLCRPEVRNALNLALIEGLTTAVAGLPASCRVLQIEGVGASFCAGADLHWMQAAQSADAASNRADAHKLAALFAALRACPQAVLAVVQGPVRGGGCGLVAAADVVVCDAAADFAFSEVRLGLLPAVIAPVVVEKIGAAAARALFLTAETFSADRALSLGLVQQVVAAKELAARAQTLAQALAQAGPVARAATKALLLRLPLLPEAERHQAAADTLAQVRAGPEAAAGLQAFFARRPPPWSVKLGDPG